MQETHHTTHSTTHLKTYAVTFHHIAGRSPHLRLRPRATAVRVVTTARAGAAARETHRWRTNYSGGLITAARAPDRTLLPLAPRCAPHSIGRASCRERV